MSGDVTSRDIKRKPDVYGGAILNLECYISKCQWKHDNDESNIQKTCLRVAREVELGK